MYLLSSYGPVLYGRILFGTLASFRERDVGDIVAVEMDGIERRELEYARQGSK